MDTKALLNRFHEQLCSASARSPLAVLTSLRGIRLLAVMFCCVLMSAIWLETAVAQESMAEQIKRMRRDLEDIQSYLYRSTSVPPAGSAVTAAPENQESNARLQRQVLEMQTQLRNLTGQLERVDHDMRQVGLRLDKLVSDIDLRLQALEGTARPGPTVVGQQTAPVTSGEPPQTVVSRDTAGTTIISSARVTGTPPPPGSGVLGQVRKSDVDAIRPGSVPQGATTAPAPVARAVQPEAPAPQAAPAPGGVTTGLAMQRPAAAQRILPEGSVQEQYTFAFKLLRKRDYEAAEAALREFVNRHPDAPLAGNAMYWMGETYYVRKNYPEAARIFLDAYQRFPKGNKAADNLFKLAKSLAQIGENKSACTTYSELVKSFPTANARILASARSDMGRLECS